jgi:hypothetical protein
MASGQNKYSGRVGIWRIAPGMPVVPLPSLLAAKDNV